jgi:RNA polymerase sigma factor (sigma-70 family)
VDDETRYRWLATHIFPCEGEVRGWVRQHVRTLPAADIDDLLQEAYARIWEADFSGLSNPRGYFYTIVRNLLLEQARRARIIPMERMSEIEALRVGGDPGPERRVSARQELERLCQIISALPAKCRQAFELRIFEGCSRGEIGSRMGISDRTVEKHLIKAYLRVGEAMGRDSVTPARDAQARNSEHDVNQ